MGTRLRTNPGTIIYSVNTGQSSGPDRGRDEMIYRGVVGYGGTIDLTPTANYLQADAGVQGFNQAQDMDFNAMVAAAENTPAQLTQDQYDAMVKEIKALNDNELLSSDDIRIGTSNILSQNGIVNDQSSLFSGSDAGGLLSKRFVIIDPEAGGAESGAGQESADTDDAADTITGSAQDSDLLDNNVDTTIVTDGAANAESILASGAATAGTNQSQEGVFSAADAIYQDYLQNPDKYVTGNIVERQLHEAALNETDPAIKASLIAEFEKYTGQPFDPSNPPMPIVKRVGMGLQRDADGNLVEGDYVGVYNAGSKTFTMADGRTIKWNGVSSVGDDGNMIVPQDGASYSLMGEYDADGNLNTRRGGIEGVVAGPPSDNGNQNANANGTPTEEGLLTIFVNQGLPGLQGALVTANMSLEDALASFPGLATAVNASGNSNSGNSNIVSGGGGNDVNNNNNNANNNNNNNVAGGGNVNSTNTSLNGTNNNNATNNSNNSGNLTNNNVNGGGDGNTNVNNNSTTSNAGGGVLTGGNNTGGAVITSGTNNTSGGTNNVTGNTNTGTGSGAGVFGTSIGPGSGPGTVNNINKEIMLNVMNEAPSVSEFFQSDIDSIKLDPTSLYYRLFA